MTAPPPRIEVVAGGPASPEEVAALAAALEVLLAEPAGPPPVSPWRWSGRTWRQEPADWRSPAVTAHPSGP